MPPLRASPRWGWAQALLPPEGHVEGAPRVEPRARGRGCGHWPGAAGVARKLCVPRPGPQPPAQRPQPGVSYLSAAAAAPAAMLPQAGPYPRPPHGSASPAPPPKGIPGLHRPRAGCGPGSRGPQSLLATPGRARSCPAGSRGPLAQPRPGRCARLCLREVTHLGARCCLDGVANCRDSQPWLRAPLVKL